VNAEILSNPRHFIPFWFEEKRLRVKGNLVLNSTDTVYELSMVFNVMWLDYKERLHRFNSDMDDDERLRGFPEMDLTKALEEFLESKRQEALDEIRTAIKYRGEAADELRRFLVAATGKADEIELAALAHLLWQVKRKMFNKKVKDHQMVIFKGSQGAGKTEAIKILFSPIKAWFKGASLKEITDDRWKFLFRNSYVVFCDELQHAEWASVDALKNIISAEEFESRKLGTNIYDNVHQNCTFVGASNRSVGELIRDPTGMRRFFQIETLARMNWDEVNSIDAFKIWQSIDETKNDPYIAPFKSQIHALQSDLILPDPEDDFVNHFQLLENVSDARSKFVTNGEMYMAYSLYVRRNGERQKPSNTFHRKIQGNGMKAFVDRQGHSGSKGYLLTQKSFDALNNFRRDHTLDF